MVKDKPQISLGAAIRRRREALKISQDSFAEMIEMHRTYYSAIERGEKNMTVQTLLQIAAGLRTKVADLFREAGY
jgi:transcriptional regulator with XRE-family HTH domain